jgi:hypothetical protein
MGFSQKIKLKTKIKLSATDINLEGGFKNTQLRVRVKNINFVKRM